MDYEKGFDLSDLLQAIDDNALSPFSMAEDEISDLVFRSHVHGDETMFNSRSLFFNIVQNILNTSTQIVQQLVQGQQICHVENDENQLKSNNFNLPLILLKQIGQKFSCASTTSEDLETEQNKIAFSIINFLNYYSFESKAILTLAAFTMEYGLFCHFVQHHQSNRLTNSLAILNGVPNLNNLRQRRRHQQTLLELNDLVIVTMQLVNKMIEVGELTFTPNNVYWAIVMVVICATNFNMLKESYDSKRMLQDLSPYVKKAYEIINNLQMEKDGSSTYNKLKKLSQSRKMITDGFKELIFHDRNNDQYLLDGLTNRRVNIDVLWSSMVFVFVSDLNVSCEEISLVTSKCEAYRKDEEYPIMWIPIVKDSINKRKHKFQDLRSQIQWYIVPNFTSKVSIRFIEQEWGFKNNSSMLLVIKQLGMVECIYKKPATHSTYGYASQEFLNCGTSHRKQHSSLGLASRRKPNCRNHKDQDPYYRSSTMFDGFQEKDDTYEMDDKSMKYDRIGFLEKEDKEKIDYKNARYDRMRFQGRDSEEEMDGESAKVYTTGFQEKDSEEDSNNVKKIPYYGKNIKMKSSSKHVSSTMNDRTGFQEKEDEDDSNDDKKIPYYGTNRKMGSFSRHTSFIKNDRIGFQEKDDEDDSNDDNKIPYYRKNRKGESSSRHASSTMNDMTVFQDKDDEDDSNDDKKIPYYGTNKKGKSSSRHASSITNDKIGFQEKEDEEESDHVSTKYDGFGY